MEAAQGASTTELHPSPCSFSHLLKLLRVHLPRHGDTCAAMLESVQGPIGGPMDKENGAPVCNGMLFSHKKGENPIVCGKMDHQVK
jgi:hypothetical protein